MANENLECIICTNTFKDDEMTVLECNHRFCFTCINKWRRLNSVCPICRREINIESENNIEIAIPVLQQREISNNSRDSTEPHQRVRNKIPLYIIVIFLMMII